MPVLPTFKKMEIRIFVRDLLIFKSRCRSLGVEREGDRQGACPLPTPQQTPLVFSIAVGVCGLCCRLNPHEL